MSSFAPYTREQLRDAYRDAWRKHLVRAPLSALDAMIVGVIELHPEYHAVIAAAPREAATGQDEAQGAPNPYLHLGLHLAVREQVSVDRPPGIRELHRELRSRRGNLHAAEHVLVEALGETLWEAQRAGRAPDELKYLELARHALAAKR
jgi:hypothetical protein